MSQYFGQTVDGQGPYWDNNGVWHAGTTFDGPGVLGAPTPGGSGLFDLLNFGRDPESTEAAPFDWENNTAPNPTASLEEDDETPPWLLTSREADRDNKQLRHHAISIDDDGNPYDSFNPLNDDGNNYACRMWGGGTPRGSRHPAFGIPQGGILGSDSTRVGWFIYDVPNLGPIIVARYDYRKLLDAPAWMLIRPMKNGKVGVSVFRDKDLGWFKMQPTEVLIAPSKLHELESEFFSIANASYSGLAKGFRSIWAVRHKTKIDLAGRTVTPPDPDILDIVEAAGRGVPKLAVEAGKQAGAIAFDVGKYVTIAVLAGAALYIAVKAKG